MDNDTARPIPFRSFPRQKWIAVLLVGVIVSIIYYGALLWLATWLIDTILASWAGT